MQTPAILAFELAKGMHQSPACTGSPEDTAAIRCSYLLISLSFSFLCLFQLMDTCLWLPFSCFFAQLVIFDWMVDVLNVISLARCSLPLSSVWVCVCVGGGGCGDRQFCYLWVDLILFRLMVKSCQSGPRVVFTLLQSLQLKYDPSGGSTECPSHHQVWSLGLATGHHLISNAKISGSLQAY